MRLVLLLTTLALASAIGACGSDDEKSDGDAAEQQAADFQRQAGAICKDVVEREVMMEARLQEKGRVDPAATQGLDARLFRRYAGLVTEMADGLQRLEAKAPDKRSLRSYLEQLGKLAKESTSTGEAIAAGRDREALAGLDKIPLELEKADDLADRLKLAPCAELGSPTLTGEA